ncbi:glycosyltransferase family 2 protein [Chryseolinea sp. T2]|uniref:glycosyltransferase family 2 protein n=1 Tax=Chryseolinea sp. T2 TaxID=3129255 RepID=UPI0030789866
MNQHPPQISIIIPVYNRAAMLDESLGRALRQKDQALEIIVVDDGSTDNTREVVMKHAQRGPVRYIFQENKERGAARNLGGSVATGMFLNFFDSDDIMLDNHISAAWTFILNNRDVQFFHTCYQVADMNGTVLSEERGASSANTKRRLISTNYLACNSVFVQRDLFLTNPFNEDRQMASSEDWELWLRLASRTQLMRCSAITFQIRNHANRSLETISTEQVITRDTKMLKYLLADQPFVATFRRYLRIFEADRYTFFALLSIVNLKNVAESKAYLWRALKTTPAVCLRKRFWATWRHVLNYSRKFN